MLNNDEDYTMLSDTDTELLLVDLPLDLIKETIRSQIENPVEYSNVNYVESVTSKLYELRSMYEDNAETLRNVDALAVDFFSFLIQELDTKFSLGVQVSYDMSEEVQQIGTALYTFLILQYKKNITKFLIKYISKNKKFINKNFESSQKKRDVTSIAVKKTVKNKDDAGILANLPLIINYILNLDIDGMEFLKYVGDSYEAGIISNLISTGNCSDSFSRDYIAYIRDEYDSALDEIKTDVLTKLSNKF